jgi:hypothetical protein
VNQICALGFAIAATLCLSACSPTARYDYVDGITEGVAHDNAVAICRRTGQIAQTNMFIAPSLAYRCVDRKDGRLQRHFQKSATVGETL